MKSPLKWYGGKNYLAPWIISRMPKHNIYVEVFGGGASVLLQKQPAQLEAYNDIYSNVTNFFKVLRDNRQEFIEYVSLIPYSINEFNFDRPVSDEVRIAAWDFVKWRQSFAGQGKSWSCSTTRSRGGRADSVNAWRNAIEGLWDVSERLLNVQIHNEHFAKFIPRFNWTGAVIYCDPPYFGETRAAKSVYHHEMVEGEHIALLNLLNATNLATVMISGYDCDLYNDILCYENRWKKHELEIANHSSGGTSKRRMIECLWTKEGNI